MNMNMLIHRIYRIICVMIGGAMALSMSIPSISVGEFSESESVFPYEIQGQSYEEESSTVDIAADLIKPDTQSNTSLLSRLTNFFRLSGTSYDTGTSKATNYIKRILNILLGLVSFLSLAMVIFAFYLIFFSKGEEAVGKAKKILVGVGIALAIMGLSRFIASFFFDIYKTVT